MKSWVYIMGTLLIITILYVGGCRRAGSWLVKEDVPAHADAMVILMGGFPDRVLETVDLYHDGKAGRLIIVEESMGPYLLLEARGADVIRTTEQARDAAVALGVPADNISMLPGEARSTLDEALIVRDYLRDKPDIDTLVLVSSPAHMRRAMMIFRSAMKYAGIPVLVGCSPSAYTNFNPEKWWKNKEDIQIVLTEYLKITSFVFFERKGIRDLNK